MLLDLLVDLIAGVIAVLIFLGIALVLLCVVGFVALLAVGIVVTLVNEVVGFYRQHFGVEGEFRRVRERLNEEERQYFDEAMEQLHIEGVSPEPPDEALVQKWREEDEELPGDAKRRGEEEKGREKKRGDGPLGGYY